MPPKRLAALAGSNAVPLMLDQTGAPLKRNFVHVSDLVSAILAALDNPAARQRLFNIAMDQTGRLRAGSPQFLPGPASCDRSKSRPPFTATGWTSPLRGPRWAGNRPSDLEAMIEMAWAWDRKEGDPRKVWYPG